MAPLQLSIVATMYRSRAYLEEFYERARAAALQLTEDYEFVLVNDGSPDDSLEVALALMERDPRVRVVDLSRNFGHHKAMMTGCAHARGDLVFLLDCDLEEAPEDLAALHEALRAEKADVAYGVQAARRGGPVERVTGACFYWIYNRLAAQPVPVNVVTMRLMTRRYVRSLIRHRDRETFLLGLWAITGYKQVPVSIRKGSKGSTTYNFGRRVELMLNAITAFSYRPLIWVFQMGMAISLLAFVGALVVAVRRMVLGSDVIGWASLMVSIWLVGGMLMLSLGVVGLYISRIFSETKDRPYTIVREVFSREREAADGPDDPALGR